VRNFAEREDNAPSKAISKKTAESDSTSGSSTSLEKERAGAAACTASASHDCQD